MLVRCYRGKLPVWAAMCVLVLCWFYIFPVYRLPRDKDIVEEVLRQGDAWQRNQTGVELYRFVSPLTFRSCVSQMMARGPPAVLHAGSMEVQKLLTECCEPRRRFAVTKENSPMGTVLWYDGEFYHSHAVNNETYPLLVKRLYDEGMRTRMFVPGKSQSKEKLRCRCCCRGFCIQGRCISGIMIGVLLLMPQIGGPVSWSVKAMNV
ncbi:Alpha-N-acetylneuraminide alpha-2,8-sialyltransferase [Liparis tanakae]|uniref:Alpha-N-acetylneuraminide alpha-2,8-sialyltransferase n=1 Tax=Liparis tanakae TaxID=230148 RepID=A0A4Z2EH94_9TELE|nr:Alpha-N-acetylneuraminide alpha-2,8-sialyltransferase [Liparis tanakae]